MTGWGDVFLPCMATKVSLASESACIPRVGHRGDRVPHAGDTAPGIVRG
jgi:hypothetical protein